jgi:RimJ/RimL family protein N-acetyltransferase
VTLVRLDWERIELVRAWRNSWWVRPFMRHQRELTADDQRRWFEQLDPVRDWYFLVEVGARPFAMFQIKKIDWDRRIGEAGGFVGDPSMVGCQEPAQATLALMDFAFLVLRLEALEAHYSPALSKIVRFNQQLGYRTQVVESDGFIAARVTRDDYLTQAGPFRSAAGHRHGAAAVLSQPGEWLAARLTSGGHDCPELELRS